MPREPELKHSIEIQGARTHNLRSIDCDIPLRKLTVISGPSGSGKSSLAFDTLYAEGQRRYVSSLSTYARQFLDRLPRPDVDRIGHVPPAIAIEQRNSVTNARATVGSATEILDHLRLLLATIGVNAQSHLLPFRAKEQLGWQLFERQVETPHRPRSEHAAKLQRYHLRQDERQILVLARPRNSPRL